MAGAFRIPGPLGIDTNRPSLDPGTLALTNMPVPDPTLAATTNAAAATVLLDPQIEALDLTGDAYAGAYALKRAHPTVQFTSGRRNKTDQARAMAGNVVRNRRWIEQTYRDSPLRDRCQGWVDSHPQANTSAEIATGLLSVFDAATTEELGRFSKHLSGEAFDVQPVTQNAEAIKQTIRGLTGLSKFLEMEGGLVRWHAQF